ncbi:FAS1 domain-containing protein [Leucogyrophana mollusca]|uniref:FAS1 domain-containing protein n=1 Tax=Leucogyrophana mollusca TaxID=85980 RepID=A0ACB8B719_9AGAM|nr:FAS1 domain-containing protein [Leucogyrophana mollusca]
MFRCLPLLLLLSIPAVLGQNYLADLVQALNITGLTQLATIAAALNNTPAGQRVISALPQGNWTVFAPNNAALQAVPASTTGDANLLADIISYHVVSGNFTNETMTYPNVTIGRTLLNDSTLVTLEGNKSQVLPWSKLENGTTAVLNNGMNISVTNTTTFQNIEILVIDQVLTPPPNISTVLANPIYNLSSLSTFLSSTQLPPSTYQGLINARGVTVFAPNDAALAAARSTLGGISTNQTALADLVSNHVINGTTVYSPSFTSSANYTSAGGETLAFVTNSSGIFVSSGGSNSVRIVQPNVLMENGVFHIIENVMSILQIDPAAASSAYESATSVAANPTTETGPVGAASTGSSGSGSASGSTGAGSTIQASGFALVAAIFFSLVGQVF